MAWTSTAWTVARLKMPAPRRTSVIHGALISSNVFGLLHVQDSLALACSVPHETAARRGQVAAGTLGKHGAGRRGKGSEPPMASASENCLPYVTPTGPARQAMAAEGA